MRTGYEIATSLLKRLREAGHLTYFAGGWVRDHLLGIHSSDTDLATSATPDEVMALFPKTIAVGKAFGVVIVVAEGHSFEVASFRKDGLYIDGRHPTSIEKGTPKEDAERRDFTINGLFFDPLTEEVIDYVGGKEDLKKGLLKAIGDPFARFQEDRLRMIRAVRFAARFNLTIDPLTEKAIQTLAPTLFPAVSPERVWQEWVKMGSFPSFGKALLLLQRLNLLPHLLPEVGTDLNHFAQQFEKLPPSLSLPLRWGLVFRNPLLENKLLELKVSKAEWNTHHFTLTSFPLIEKFLEGEDSDPVAWVALFAHSIADEFLQGIFSLFPIENLLKAKQEVLKEAIQRKKNKKYLLGTDRLKQEGILPGKKMGFLLETGENEAIRRHLASEEEVLCYLKSLPEWSHHA